MLLFLPFIFLNTIYPNIMVNMTVIALLAVTAGTFLNSLGFVLMKLSIINSETTKKNFIINWRYLLALSLLLFAALMNIGEQIYSCFDVIFKQAVWRLLT